MIISVLGVLTAVMPSLSLTAVTLRHAVNEQQAVDQPELLLQLSLRL
jgi:hypothetical protein